MSVADKAFEIMVRRGWFVMLNTFDDQLRGQWIVCSRPPKGAPNVIYRKCHEEDMPLPPETSWREPYTALVEADRWYRENFEREDQCQPVSS